MHVGDRVQRRFVLNPNDPHDELGTVAGFTVDPAVVVVCWDSDPDLKRHHQGKDLLIMTESLDTDGSESDPIRLGQRVMRKATGAVGTVKHITPNGERRLYLVWDESALLPIWLTPGEVRPWSEDDEPQVMPLQDWEKAKLADDSKRGEGDFVGAVKELTSVLAEEQRAADGSPSALYGNSIVLSVSEGVKNAYQALQAAENRFEQATQDVREAREHYARMSERKEDIELGYRLGRVDGESE